MVSLCDIPPRVAYLQPECSFHLTVTWNPTEEGGIRELLVFGANGVLKHQAVMLGRAEAPKKKKVQDVVASPPTHPAVERCCINVQSLKPGQSLGPLVIFIAKKKK